jgi:NRPS condensation-like uncharacterized protein
MARWGSHFTQTESQFMKSENASTFLRVLGSFENLFYLRQCNHPMHFSVIVEVNVNPTLESLRSALNQLQRRHPLLSARIVGRGAEGPAFHRSDAPIEVTLAKQPDTWQKIVSAELARPFDRQAAPLVRAAMVPGEDSAHIVLTFHHAVSDGVSGMTVLRDLVGALGGVTLAPRDLPLSQEELLARTPGLPSPAELLASLPDAQPDDPMSPPKPVRPFDGTLPSVLSEALDPELTRKLVARSRAEDTTVHSVLCAAATQVVLGEAGNADAFVRVLSPISLRHVIDIEQDSGLYIGVARTGFPAGETTDLWKLARATGESLAPARSAVGLATASAVGASLVPLGSPATAAAEFLVAAASYDVEVTNVGVVDLDGPGSVQATAVWGPVTLNQLEGERVIGVATLGGSLRLTLATYTHSPSFLSDIQNVLVQALAGPPSTHRSALE